jgi:hypothetical protein
LNTYMTKSEVHLEIEGVPERRLAELQRELVLELSRSRELAAEPVRREARPGERALGIEAIGSLLVSVLCTGATQSLAECLRSLIMRDGRIRFTLTRSDGLEVKIDAKNMTPAHVERLVRAFEAQ